MHPFQAFSIPHISILVFLTLLAIVALYIGRKKNHEDRHKMVIIMAGLTLSLELIETVVKLFNGTYNYHADLPLFLCDIAAFMLPFVLLFENRRWLGILYFWTMAGTLQALITPELDRNFPAAEFFRYFLMHGGIVITVFCTILFFNIKIGWKDLVNAVLYAQVYLVFIHVFNQATGSNYSYTVQKPYSATILDYFGPWPWYIVWGELLMVILFVILWLPFLVLVRKSQGTRGESVESFGMGD